MLRERRRMERNRRPRSLNMPLLKPLLGPGSVRRRHRGDESQHHGAGLQQPQTIGAGNNITVP